MKLGLSEVLVGNAQALMVPRAEDSAGDYSAGMAGVVAMLCVLAAQEAEGAAALRVAENREMRALFARAVEDGCAGALHAQLRHLSRERNDDLRLSALDAAGDGLRGALIELHVLAEQTGLVRLEADILRLLAGFAEKRRLSIPIQAAS